MRRLMPLLCSPLSISTVKSVLGVHLTVTVVVASSGLLLTTAGRTNMSGRARSEHPEKTVTLTGIVLVVRPAYAGAARVAARHPAMIAAAVRRLRLVTKPPGHSKGWRLRTNP